MSSSRKRLRDDFGSPKRSNDHSTTHKQLSASYFEKVTTVLAAAHGGIPARDATPSILDSLIRTILSQNTTDATSSVAFKRLKASFPTWRAVLDAPPGAAEECVRCGGLAEVKMRRIRDILRSARKEDDEPSLEWLRDQSDDDIHRFLSALKGVGPKTVACVLIFAFGRQDFPVSPLNIQRPFNLPQVDTHVLHIAQRLGWLPTSATRDGAYDILRSLVPPHLMFALHVLLVAHGKACAACAKKGRMQPGQPRTFTRSECPLHDYKLR